MNDVLYTGRKSEVFNLRMPERMKVEVSELAGWDGISINSVIIQMVAKCIRERRENDKR